MLSYIAREAARRAKAGAPVDIVAHRAELIAQISGTLDRMGVHHGMISPRYTPDPLALVQVSSVQTLVMRLKRNPRRSSLLIVDEAHHLLKTNQWGRAHETLGNPKMLGVTATPTRGDGRGLGVEAGGVFDAMIEVISVRELIELGNLVRPIVYAPAQHIDLSGIRSRGGDYERKELAGRLDKPMITGDAVANYRAKCEYTPAIAFGVSIEHCEHIAAEFRAAGYNFQAIDGSMDDATRDALVRGLGRDIHGLVSADLIGEGVDIPAVGCAILLRPTQSLGLYIQQVGRALRPLPGKDHATILDHVGNSLIHGLPEEDREWSLEGIKKRGKSGGGGAGERVKQCPQCFAVHPIAPACEHCGHLYPNGAREIERQEGELQEVTAAIAAQLREEKKREVHAARTLEALKEIEARRGYKKGWAAHIFQSRMGRQADKE